MRNAHTPDEHDNFWPAYYASLQPDEQAWARDWLDALSEELDGHLDDLASAKMLGDDDRRRAVMAQLFANLNAVSNLHTGYWQARETEAT
jgi:hypothetical protein